MTPEPDRFSAAETLASEPPRRRLPRSLLLAATSALIVVTGAGVAGAAVFSPSPAPAPTAGGPATPTASPSTVPSDGAPGQRFGRGHRAGMGGPALHGEFVVRDGEGAYATVATQHGDVTAVDQDSITVRSEDGYTREYAVNGDTRINRGAAGIDTVKTGQKIRVVARVNAGTATAVMIHDGAVRGPHGRRGERGHRHGDHRPDRPPVTSPAPATPSPATTSPVPGS